MFFPPVFVCVKKNGLTRWVRPSRPASACIFSTLKLSLVLTDGDSSHFSRIPIPPTAPSGQSRVYHAMQMRSDGVHCRESADTGPVVLKVVRITGAAFSSVAMDQLMRSNGARVDDANFLEVLAWLESCGLHPVVCLMWLRRTLIKLQRKRHHVFSFHGIHGLRTELRQIIQKRACSRVSNASDKS